MLAKRNTQECASPPLFNGLADEKVIRDAGVIKSVTLTDFMCHRHLTAEFGEKMNFLVGHNGSESYFRGTHRTMLTHLRW
jgi:hypothetical protein